MYTTVSGLLTRGTRNTDVVLGVNGSQMQLLATMRPYETDSTLNDEGGVWIASHGMNRYREWDELRYSMRSIAKYASSFANRVQILVNAFEERSDNGTRVSRMGKQRPNWLNDDTRQIPVQVLSQEQFFGPEEKKCLPSFDSLTIENQLYNTKSETDRVRQKNIDSCEVSAYVNYSFSLFPTICYWANHMPLLTCTRPYLALRLASKKTHTTHYNPQPQKTLNDSVKSPFSSTHHGY